MSVGRVVRHISYLGLSVEQGTDQVPDDDRFHVVHNGVVVRSCKSDTVALAYAELLEEELLEADPSIKNPADFLRQERAFGDILSVRGDARRRARTQAQGSGGKGGRGGV
ncbi:MAG: hypothetical protein WA991_03865 [Ornithinimicrobium sp.]